VKWSIESNEAILRPNPSFQLDIDPLSSSGKCTRETDVRWNWAKENTNDI